MLRTAAVVVGLMVAAAAPGHAAPLPSGPSVWLNTSGSRAQLLRVWHSGSGLRIYYDDGFYPGDGRDCAWGTLAGTMFTGQIQRVAPDPMNVTLRISRRGSHLRVHGLDGAPTTWHRSSLKHFTKRVPQAKGATGGWCKTYPPTPAPVAPQLPAPAPPEPEPAPTTPAPSPTPTPTTPPPPPAATIVVNTCNTYNNCDYWNPIRVHANPAVSSHIADASRGTSLTARCWATGITLTDGSNQTSEDDARQFTSSLWYGIDWNGGRGYVPAVWTTKREDHLGLPGC